MTLSFYKNFLDSDFTTRIPVVAPILLTGLSCAGIRYINKGFYFLDTGKVPLLEEQKDSNPVLLFDYNTLLIKKQFFPFAFNNFTKRHSEEFIYTMAHYYELVCLTDVPSFFASSDLARLDSLGCISYKIFVKDKRAFDKKCLNRSTEHLVVLSGRQGEFNPDFNENTLTICNNQDKLLDISHFLINLYYSKIPDYRETIMSYKGSSFSNTFKRVQEELYNQRNLFDLTRLFRGDRFEAKLNEVNQSKINDYRSMRQKIFGSEKSERYWNITKNAIKTILF